MKDSNTYGPDLSEHETEAAKIATVGLRSIKGDRATSECEKADGPDTSRNGLEKLK